MEQRGQMDKRVRLDDGSAYAQGQKTKVGPAAPVRISYRTSVSPKGRTFACCCSIAASGGTASCAACTHPRSLRLVNHRQETEPRCTYPVERQHQAAGRDARLLERVDDVVQQAAQQRGRVRRRGPRRPQPHLSSTNTSIFKLELTVVSVDKRSRLVCAPAGRRPAAAAARPPRPMLPTPPPT